MIEPHTAAHYTDLETTNAPPWLTDLARHYRDLFGIGAWYINVKLVRAPGGDIDKEGQSRIDLRYLSAHIELCETMPEEGLRHTLMHEMLHIALAPIDLAHSRMREMVKKKHRDHVDELFADGLEQTIERLTRALERHIKPPPTQEQAP